MTMSNQRFSEGERVEVFARQVDATTGRKTTRYDWSGATYVSMTPMGLHSVRLDSGRKRAFESQYIRRAGRQP